TNDDTGTTNLPARPGVAPVLRACRVPVTRMDRPVLVSAGGADEIVPLVVVERFVADLAGAGTPVRFDRHADAGHADVLRAGQDRLIGWADELIRGEAAAPAFDPLDADGDGSLTRDDFDVVALRLAQGAGEPPGSPRARAIRHGYRALWRRLAERADTDADGRVTRAEFQRLLSEDPTALAALHDLV
ncbi:EF-hand domain-containing protein, partial [Actinosynnema sp. NPDC059797]